MNVESGCYELKAKKPQCIGYCQAIIMLCLAMQQGRKLGSLHSTSRWPAHIPQILPRLTFQLSAFIFISLHLCIYIYILIYIYFCMYDVHYCYTNIFHNIHKKTTDNGNNSIHSIPPVTVTSRTTPWAPSASSPWSAKGALAVSTKPVIYDQAAVGSVGWNMLEGQHVCLAHWYLGIVDTKRLR